MEDSVKIEVSLHKTPTTLTNVKTVTLADENLTSHDRAYIEDHYDDDIVDETPKNDNEEDCFYGQEDQ